MKVNHTDIQELEELTARRLALQNCQRRACGQKENGFHWKRSEEHLSAKYVAQQEKRVYLFKKLFKI